MNHEKVELAGGRVVLDPYMGSGSTGVACLQTGRKFIGVEIDADNFANAVQRISEQWRRMGADDHDRD